MAAEISVGPLPGLRERRQTGISDGRPRVIPVIDFSSDRIYR